MSKKTSSISGYGRVGISDSEFGNAVKKRINQH